LCREYGLDVAQIILDRQTADVRTADAEQNVDTWQSDD